MISRHAVSLGALALAAGAFASLGAWQVSRGKAREAYLAGKAAQAPVPMRGAYLAERQLLLDGQAHDGKPGYHAWTPLRRADGHLVIVDRGWVPLPAPSLPAPAGDVLISGKWRPLPAPALRLSGEDCAARPFPAVVEYPTLAELKCRLGAPVEDGVLQLDPAAPGGFVREWSEAGFPPARHYAYAAQWFGFCAVALFVLFRSIRK